MMKYQEKCKYLLQMEHMDADLARKYFWSKQFSDCRVGEFENFRFSIGRLRKLAGKELAIPNNKDKRIEWFQKLSAGNRVGFGKYHGGRFSKNSISWEVIERRGNQVLLLCDHVMEGRCFHNTQSKKEVHWAESDIRNWLNTTFLHKAFSASERKMIMTVENDNGSLIPSGPKCEHVKVFL